MSKKQDILEKLLKAQREGKLNNHMVIAKVEALPEAAFEDEPLAKADKKFTHMKWHIAETKSDGTAQIYGQVSARHSVGAIDRFKQDNPKFKDRDLKAWIISSSGHTPISKSDELEKKDKNIIHDISVKGHGSALKEQSGQDLPHATHDMVSHSFHPSTDWDEPNRMAQLAVEHGKAGHKVHVSQHEGGNLMTVWKPKKGK